MFDFGKDESVFEKEEEDDLELEKKEKLLTYLSLV